MLALYYIVTLYILGGTLYVCLSVYLFVCLVMRYYQCVRRVSVLVNSGTGILYKKLWNMLDFDESRPSDLYCTEGENDLLYVLSVFLTSYGEIRYTSRNGVE